MRTVNDLLPVVSFSDLQAGGRDSRAAETMHRACCESGFFYLSDFVTESAIIRETEEQMRWFFSLPKQQKRQLQRNEDNSRGYYDNELTKNTRDMKEVFDFGYVPTPDLPDDDLANRDQDGWNQWPDGERGVKFKTILNRYYEHCGFVALGLLQALFRNLGVDGTHLQTDFSPRHSSFLRLNYYPVEDPLSMGGTQRDHAADSGHLGVHHHTDAGALTLLWQDGVGGLEIFHEERWLGVTPMAGTIVVNIGDIVQVWSNDLYRAPLHRVVASTRCDRYSMPYFYNPVYSADYQPLPTINGSPSKAKYSQINWGHFRFHRQHGDYEDYGEEIQISDYQI